MRPPFGLSVHVLRLLRFEVGRRGAVHWRSVGRLLLLRGLGRGVGRLGRRRGRHGLRNDGV